MSKERLEEHTHVAISISEYKSLKERVQELEEENTGLKQELKDVSDRLEWVSDV